MPSTGSCCTRWRWRRERRSGCSRRLSASPTRPSRAGTADWLKPSACACTASSTASALAGWTGSSACRPPLAARRGWRQRSRAGPISGGCGCTPGAPRSSAPCRRGLLSSGTRYSCAACPAAAMSPPSPRTRFCTSSPPSSIQATPVPCRPTGSRRFAKPPRRRSRRHPRWPRRRACSPGPRLGRLRCAPRTTRCSPSWPATAGRRSPTSPPRRTGTSRPCVAGSRNCGKPGCCTSTSTSTTRPSGSTRR